MTAKKAVLRGKFVRMNAYVSKKKTLKIDNLSFYMEVEQKLVELKTGDQ